MDVTIPFLSEWLDGLMLLFKLYAGLMIGVFLIALAFVFNAVFGINVSQYMLELTKFMFDGIKSLWLWTVSTFHYDNKRELFALALLSFVLFIFLMMAFNVNKMNTAEGASTGAGSISFGSDAIRKSSSGEGAKTGSGYLPTDTGGTGSTVTTLSGASTTETTETTLVPPETVQPNSTLPDHCFNGNKDGDEEAVDCGGSECTPCHCFNHAEDSGENGVDCGGGCPDSCSCDEPYWDFNDCALQFCCPESADVPDFCWKRCATIDTSGNYNTVLYSGQTASELLAKCEVGACHQANYVWVTEQNASVGVTSGVLDWY